MTSARNKRLSHPHFMRISIEEAIVHLQKGRVVALPTETVYGLAASLAHEDAIREIFRLKGRPSSNPLIIHLADPEQIFFLSSYLPPQTAALMAGFWPGALTLVLPVHEESIPTVVRAGLPTAGFRIPKHPLVRKVLESTGPLVMPSANLSGRPSATRVEHVEEDFGIDFPCLDGLSCAEGVESTILLYQNEAWRIGRLGAIPAEACVPILGYMPELVVKESLEAPLCPGLAFRHYAPQAALFFDKAELLKGTCAILGFEERTYPAGHPIFFLGSLQDAASVAERLYGVLRLLDQEKVERAWLDMDFPRTGLWLTVAERLRRAAEEGGEHGVKDRGSNQKL